LGIRAIRFTRSSRWGESGALLTIMVNDGYRFLTSRLDQSGMRMIMQLATTLKIFEGREFSTLTKLYGIKFICFKAA